MIYRPTIEVREDMVIAQDYSLDQSALARHIHARGRPAILGVRTATPTPLHRRGTRLPQGAVVTVGIGVLCQNAQCIVMATDVRGSYSDKTLGQHDQIGKQYDLPLGFCANIAGTVNVCGSVIAYLTQHMEDLKKEPEVFHDHIRYAVRDAQIGELSFLYEYALRNNLGIGLKEWQAGWIKEPKLRRAGRALFRLTPFEVELTVGGFLNDLPVLLEAIGKEAVEISHGISVIGCGWPAALKVLNGRNQNAYTSIMSTVMNVCEALDAARNAEPSTVGKPADYVVITPKQNRRLPVDFAREFLAKHGSRDRDELDDDEAAFKEIMSALYTAGVTRKEYAEGKRSPSASRRSVSRKSGDQQ